MAFRHRAYGVARDSAGSVPFELRYRWIGREFDEETGLYYLRARYYDPQSQRFTQEDPIGFGGGANVYAYGNGNPTNGRDLNGMAMNYEFSGPSPRLLEMMDCMGTLAGCSGGAGLTWHRYDGFIGGLMDEADLMPQLEREAQYRDYKEKAEDRISKMQDNDGVRPMSQREYERAMGWSRHQGGVADISHMALRQAVANWIQNGFVVVGDDWLVRHRPGPGVIMAGAYSPADGLVVMRSSTFGSANIRSGLLANVLVHEFVHFSGVQSRYLPCIIANRYTPYRGGLAACGSH